MIPLSDRLRPKTLKDFVGQRHLLSEDKLLFQLLKSKKIFSMILWGPPGVGKTTIARILAKEIGAEFLEFSAVNTGTAELKKVFEEIKNRPLFKESVIVFIDEIHRFNKAQQDAFLPLVETGRIILIGATTENPSFEIIAPLLSRSRVLVLERLSEDDLSEIIKRGLKELNAKIDKKAEHLLMELCGGDGRIMLNTLYEAYFKALEDVEKFGNLPIPLMIRNAPTKLMKDLSYGKGYQKYTDEDLLPEKLKGKKYYIPKPKN